jgi:hypothetical protein
VSNLKDSATWWRIRSYLATCGTHRDHPSYWERRSVAIAWVELRIREAIRTHAIPNPADSWEARIVAAHAFELHAGVPAP